MAFNNVGAIVTLAPGEVVRWTYGVQGADSGAQFAAPDVKTRGGRLMAFNQSKRLSLDAIGRVHATYSVDIRNDGSGAVGHNLQGGGMAFGFNNVLEITTLAPGAAVKASFRFGGPLAPPSERDHGAQFFAADIKNLDCEVVALLQGKEIEPGHGVRYAAIYLNNGPATAAYNYQGGGFSPGFNDLGDLVTIAPGQTELYHFFFGLAREDRGAQYAGAHVHTEGAELAALSHGKELGVFGIDYYVTIRNDGPAAAAYNLQGGSLF